MNNTVYIYIEQKARKRFNISGYDAKTGRDLWEQRYIDYNRREALARFRAEYEIKGRHADIINLQEG